MQPANLPINDSAVKQPTGSTGLCFWGGAQANTNLQSYEKIIKKLKSIKIIKNSFSKKF